MTTSTPPEWDPVIYERNASHRTRAIDDLLRALPADVEPQVIVDLGCGSGLSTLALQTRWPTARITGVDRSTTMLDAARSRCRRITWQCADLTTWEGDGNVELIVSNAAFHWVDDHGSLLGRLMNQLVPGGFIAVQMPLSDDQPSHRLMREALETTQLADLPAVQERSRPGAATAEAYYGWLASHASTVDIWETEYLHPLEGDDAVLAWLQGAGLRPILHALTPEDADRYLDALRPRLRAAYPQDARGITLYPFRRLFMIARRR